MAAGKKGTAVASARRSKIVINRVYTRTGDKGSTALVGGKRVPKDADRIEAYGTLDELNATLGVVRSTMEEEEAISPQVEELLEVILKRVQNELFDLGSELATPPEVFQDGMPMVLGESVLQMEKWMDRCTDDLDPLTSFVLPGGGPLSSLLHVSRTVCRRAERRVIHLSRAETVRPEAIKYLNRLSDLLFVLSRWVGKKMSETEYLWEPMASRTR